MEKPRDRRVYGCSEAGGVAQSPGETASQNHPDIMK